MKALKFLAAFIPLMLINGIASAQSYNPFNPDYAWCSVQGSIVYRSSNYWKCLPPGTAGQVVQSNGPNADLGWFTTSGIGTVTSVGMALPNIFNVTGSPVTISGTLTATLASQTAGYVWAAPAASAGAPVFRALVASDVPQLAAANMPALTGDVTTSAGSTVTAITAGAVNSTALAANAVTTSKVGANQIDNSKLASMPALSVKANMTGVTGNAADNSLSQILDASMSNVQGSVIYRNASNWTALPTGTSGQFLMTQGAGANPIWGAVSGASGGTVTSVTCNNGLSGGTFTLSGTCALDAISSATVLSNTTGVSAVPVGNTLSNIMDAAFSAHQQGDVVERGPTAWGVRHAGAVNTVLTANGAGNNLSWGNLVAPFNASFNASAGNILYANGTTWTTLAPGASGQLLMANGASAPSYIYLTSLLDGQVGNAIGGIAIRGSVGWQQLTSGASGQILTSAGAGALPTWQAPYAPTPGQVVGTATNDNAAAGNVGEYFEMNGTGTAAASQTSMATVNLSAGDWNGFGTAIINGDVPSSDVKCGLNTANNFTGMTTSDILDFNQGSGIISYAAARNTQALPPQRFSLASAATVYLTCISTGSTRAINYKVVFRRAR